MANDAGLRLPNNLSELTSSWVSNENHKYTPQFSDLMQSHTLNAPYMDAKPSSESNPQRHETKAVGNLTELQGTVHFAPPRPVRLDSGSFELVESPEVAHNNYSVKVSEPTSTNKVTQSNGNYLGHSISPNLYDVRQTNSNNPVQVWPLGHFIGNDASEQWKFWESIKDNSSVSASRSYLQSSENKSQPAYPNQSKHPGLSN